MLSWHGRLRRVIAWATLWAIGILGLIVIIKPSEPFKGCVHNSKNAAEYEELHEPGTAPVATITRFYLRSRLVAICAANFADKNERTIGALAAVALAVFTLYLWRATRGLRRYAGIQVDDMRQLLAAARDNAAAAASQVEAMTGLRDAAKEQEIAIREQATATAAVAKAAQTSANAATLHATAVVRSEMPVVRLHTLQMKDHETGAVVGAGPPPQHVNISTTFMNHGRTTAFPLRLSLGHHITKDLPKEPVYIRPIDFEPDLLIRPDREFRIRPDHSVWITNEAYRPFAEMIVQRQAEFWFFGMLEFEDFLGERNAWRFCARWVPYLPPVPGEPREPPPRPRGGFVEGGPAKYREQGGHSQARPAHAQSGFLLPISPPSED
jgi:hypothetical protein